MTWLQLIVLCTWLSAAIIVAAMMVGKLAVGTLNIVSGKVEEIEGEMEDLREKVENLERETR
jgi:hypothetical protein